LRGRGREGAETKVQLNIESLCLLEPPGTSGTWFANLHKVIKPGAGFNRVNINKTNPGNFFLRDRWIAGGLNCILDR